MGGESGMVRLSELLNINYFSEAPHKGLTPCILHDFTAYLAYIIACRRRRRRWQGGVRDKG